MNSEIFDLQTSMKKYYFIFRQWLKRDLQSRYRGSLLGLAWPVLHPLIQTAVFTLVLHHYMKIRWLPPEAHDGFRSSSLSFGEAGIYAFNVLCGLSVFNFFSELMGKSPSLILAQPNLVTKVKFPLYILPLTTVGSAMIIMISSILIMMLISIFAGGWPAQILWIPIWLAPILIYGIAISISLSALGVFVRDIAQIMPSIVSLLFFITPIFYPTDTIPEDLRFLANLNPIAWGVDSLRGLILSNHRLDWGLWSLHLLASIICGGVAIFLFSRLRKGFADVV